MTNTSSQGFIVFNDGSWVHLFQAIDGTVLVDTAEQELAVRTPGGTYESLWKSHMGKSISRIAWQVADGSFVTSLKLYDAMNGVVAYFTGSERNVTTVVNHEIYNVDVRGLAIPVTRGLVIKGDTTD